MDLSSLNKQQKEAVTTSSGAVLVIAGAGSGKTRVLTYRIAELIERGVKPYQILAITFTNKAAKEMRARVESLVGSSANNTTISTFHAFGAKFLRYEIEVLGYRRSFTIFDSNDQQAIIKQIFKTLDMDSKRYNIRAFLNKISKLKNEGISAKGYEKLIETDYDKQFGRVYRNYEEMLFNNNGVDFDDLLILPLKILREFPEILSKYQQRYQYVLVDEYQDTNSLQYELVKLLSQKQQNIFVVGDADQSIYSWRGADMRNILNFEKDYPNAKVILLEENYRSTQNILDAANCVIKNNVNRKEKNLFTSKGEGELLTYMRYTNEFEEAEHVIDKITTLKRSGTSYENIAILYRTNAQSRVFEELLLRENIPYKIVGSFYFYARKEIKDIMSYLRLIINPDDDVSFLRVINYPKRGIGSTTVSKLQEIASANEKSLFSTIDLGALSNSANEKLFKFRDMIYELIAVSEEISIVSLIEEVLAKTNYLASLQADKSLDSEVKQEYVEEFINVARSFLEKHEEVELELFLEEISLVADMTMHHDDYQGLTLMTLHSAKGLEFEHVFLIGMEENIFPHRNSLDSDAELEEERRLCYVGITRAKETIHLSNAKTRLFFGNRIMNPESRFLNEIDNHLIEGELASQRKVVLKSAYDEQSYAAEVQVEYEKGAKVYHHNFGEGVIVNSQEDIITVAFASPHGVKKISALYNSLKKLGDVNE